MINRVTDDSGSDMTFSILARDPETGALGGAAATGSLCVGGWVLRGIAGVGMSASQGKSPSTLWGEAALTHMARGQPVEQTLRTVVEPDGGKAQRQLALLDGAGNGAVFSGDDNLPVIGEQVFDGGVAAGNMLSAGAVIDAMVERFLNAPQPFSARLLTALRAAERAGSDVRGLQSAALLILSPSQAPLTLRIDQSDDPLAALEDLHRQATTGEYARWAAHVPTLSDPERRFD